MTDCRTNAIHLAAGTLFAGTLVVSGAVGAQTHAEDAFVTTWQIEKSGQEITVPTASGADYDFTIDWGDGTVEAISGTDPDATPMLIPELTM